MPANLLEQIRVWLTSAGVSFREIHHAPTHSSEASARARGERIEIGGKALLMKIETAEPVFCLFVLSAALKLDSGAIKHHFGVKRTRFATPEELLALTGLVPGGVPPFGPPILPFALYLDESITRNERIAFNAGSLTDSIIMSVSDYLRLAQPKTIFKFAN